MTPVHHPLTQLFANPEHKIAPVMKGGDERWKIRGGGGYDKEGKVGKDEEENDEIWRNDKSREKIEWTA